MWVTGCSLDVEWLVAQRVYGELRRRLATPLSVRVGEKLEAVWPTPSGFLALDSTAQGKVLWVWDADVGEPRSLRLAFPEPPSPLPPDNVHVLGWTPDPHRPSLRLLWKGHVFSYPEGVQGDSLVGGRLSFLEALTGEGCNVMLLQPDRLLAVKAVQHHGVRPALAIYEAPFGSSFLRRSLWLFPADRLFSAPHHLSPTFTFSPTGHRTFYGYFSSFPGVRYALIFPPGERGAQTFWLTHGLDHPAYSVFARHTPWTPVDLLSLIKGVAVFSPNHTLRWWLPEPKGLSAPAHHAVWFRGRLTVLWFPEKGMLSWERVPVVADVLEQDAFRRYRLSIPKRIFQDVLVSLLPGEFVTVASPVADGFVLLGYKFPNEVYLVTDRHFHPFWTSLRFESRDDRAYPPQPVPRISLLPVEG